MGCYTYEPSCTRMPARLFFMFEDRGPQGTAGCVAAQNPPCREAGSEVTGHEAHRSFPNGSRATVHMAALESFLSGRRDLEPLNTWCIEALPAGPEPRYTWWCRSPSYQRGGIQFYRARGGAWVHALLPILI
jgi:hypothetical protein